MHSKPAASRRPEPTGHHNVLWRDPAQVLQAGVGAAAIAPEWFRYQVEGSFWKILEALQITLLATREYEHLVMAFQISSGNLRISYLPVPHPSGLAIDRTRGSVHLASTRNPNQIYELYPVGRPKKRGVRATDGDAPCLMPLRSHVLPGSLYLHDLALIGGVLHANAVGHNAVIRFDANGTYERVWWPRCIERGGKSAFERNSIQLNSIAAGATLSRSYFSASTDSICNRRPGHLNFAAGGTGVIFSGRTREAILRGLTRPHSARLHEGRLWLCNSGHGEVGFAADGQFAVVAKLPGWTRGLCFADQIAFVGTSRILPRFRHYAPGLNPDASRCAIHALDAKTGKALGRLWFPSGDQIFAIDWLPSQLATSLPFSPRRAVRRETMLFHSFTDPFVRRSR